ncbi:MULTISPECIES: polyprenyl synthetase family protein [Proteiniphilum]|uniref:polyprenyl synthetase family protein n=1 Tax=Proteiniphilum TaxID=294702 RepID=UPI0028AC4B52|nr:MULTISPECIES: polyprenyl synthetase family protein [Proteiniphilum]MDY9917890.1 polyprenyl synthetase family protein [Proteiniphilum sp.]
MDQSQVIRDFLQEELELFDTYLRESIKNDNPRISGIIDYVFKANGKRLRPMLVLLTAKACGQIIPETYHGAVTVELLHTATLVHDDVIDKSDMRRGRRSVNAVYDNTRAVLVGDYLLSSALAESVKTKDLNIVRIMSELGKSLAEGELVQFALAEEILIDEVSYFQVIEKKTASLLRASITIGAITGGASPQTISGFSRLGGILGICFQIRDDIFDYYKTDVGKPTGNDIREGKVTLPLIYALQHAPRTVSDGMLKIIQSRDYSDENIERVLDFAKEYGGVEYAYKKIRELLDEAETIISELSIDDQIKTLLRLLLIYLNDRDH